MVKEANNDRSTILYSPLVTDEAQDDAHYRKIALGISVFVLAISLSPFLLGHALLGGFGLTVASLIKGLGLVNATILTAIPATALADYGLQMAGIYDQ